jgi:cytochrome c oxidase subunit 1
MMGSAMIAFFAGLHYWWPKITGRMYSEKWGAIGAALVFIGFNATFFVQFIMGSQGMPRRYYDYVPEYYIYHLISSIGSYILAIGFVVMAIYLVHSLFRGRRAPANPWGGASLEWTCGSPPPYYNFHTPPPAGDPYNYHRLVYDPQLGGYVARGGGGAPQPAGEGG